ncbi:unnamed protein product [marine sediment metagenome]|uniref:YopX protein domain-containing protein n=1 Tax=marine sediment metagenome TaxID=412755 RepID=X1EGV1_9ZZZZ
MREIKFRAWNKESKKMGDGESLASWCLTELNNGIAMGLAGMHQERYDNREDFHSHLEIMQYTGLKDSLNNEEYFGDIIQEDGYSKRIIEDGASAVLFVSIENKNDIKY